MRRGKHISDLTKEESRLLEPINQRDEGVERALLVLHGFSSSPAVYRYVIPKLKNYNAIVCPVLPGHGESIEQFSHSKASDWLVKAKEASAELFKEYKKVDVLGLSLGGLLACELSKCSDFNRLFLLAPALKLNMRINFLLKLGAVLSYLGFLYVRNKAGNILSNDSAEIAYKKLPIATIIEMLTLVEHHQWVAPTCPVDLFLGAYDEVVASKQVEELFVNLPNVSIHWLNNSAHVLPLDNDLNMIVDCINSKK
jgi:carboxylesterase